MRSLHPSDFACDPPKVRVALKNSATLARGGRGYLYYTRGHNRYNSGLSKRAHGRSILINEAGEEERKRERRLEKRMLNFFSHHRCPHPPVPGPNFSSGGSDGDKSIARCCSSRLYHRDIRILFLFSIPLCSHVVIDRANVCVCVAG